MKTKIWVDALVRRAETGFASAYVIRRGDEDAGAVLVKVVAADRLARLFVPARDEQGERVWQLFRKDAVPESEADAYCARRSDDDPDIWIVEIEDREGRHFLTEPVEKL
nr:DUF1491 family protein [Maricaulis parjimensis]